MAGGLFYALAPAAKVTALSGFTNHLIPIKTTPPPPANAPLPPDVTPVVVPTYNPDASAYLNAYDPSGTLYAVQTGQANVRQLEDLQAIFSSAPQAPQASYSSFIIPVALIFAVTYFLKRGS